MENGIKRNVYYGEKIEIIYNYLIIYISINFLMMPSYAITYIKLENIW